MEAIKFDMGVLDASDISDADLNPPQRLKAEGTYEFTIDKVEINPKKKDGTNQANLEGVNGSVFAPVKLTLGTVVDGDNYTIDHKFFVPVQGPLKYQKEGGNPSMCFTGPVKKFIEALTGIEIKSNGDLIDNIKNLGDLLTSGNTVWGRVGSKSKDKVQRHSDTEFTVLLADKTELENDEGEKAVADSYEGITNLYEEILGRKYQGGVEIKSFFIPKSEA